MKIQTNKRLMRQKMPKLNNCFSPHTHTQKKHGVHFCVSQLFFGMGPATEIGS